MSEDDLDAIEETDELIDELDGGPTEDFDDTDDDFDDTDEEFEETDLDDLDDGEHQDDDLEGDAVDGETVINAVVLDTEDEIAVVVEEDDGGEDDELRDGEFVCRSCFMAKRESALADADRMLCRDCA